MKLHFTKTWTRKFTDSDNDYGAGPLSKFKPSEKRPPSENLKKYLDYYKITPTEFADLTGMSVSKINDIIYRGYVCEDIFDRLNKEFINNQRFWKVIDKLNRKKL